MKHSKSLNSLFLATVVLLFTLNNSCGTSRKISQAEVGDRNITILAVNDMHAAIDNFPRFAFMVDSLRDIYPDMLLISGGDNQTGNPVNDQYQPKGQPMIELMNTAKFDFSVVGNHEFDTTAEGFNLLVENANFDFICANTLPDDGNKIKLEPYKIITMPNGVKLAFTSVLDINMTGIPDTHPKNTDGFAFGDPVSTAQELLHLKDSADILVFVNHFGFENDVELANTLPPNVVDLIIGAHSHTKVDTEQIHNGILITQAERRLNYATLISLSLKANGQLERNMKLLTVGNKGSEKADIRAMVDRYNDNPMLKEQIAIAEADFTTYEQIGFLMVDALRIGTEVDIALINPGGVRINHLPKGNISIMDAYSCDPFGNEIVLFNLTGHELKNLHLVAYPMDEQLPIYPSGMKSKYHIDKDGSLSNVEFFNSDGSVFDMDKTYTVAVNSYIASAYKFEKDDEGTGLFQGTAENMIEYLRKTNIVPSYQGEERIEFITID